jgi:hypothetical protein
MHPRTIATLDRLDETEWFTQVGLDDDVENACILTSWQKAIEYCAWIEWKNIRLEAANVLWEKLLLGPLDRFGLWNDTMAEVKEAAIPFAKRKIEAVVRENNLPPVFEQAVEWDIIHVCMEAEYADVVPPGFYANLCYWYTVGHFQCGWEGGFSDGRPIIY